MLRSMYSSIGALKNFQTKLDVIGNNIANVNTFGFKKGRTTFQEMMLQQVSGASGPAAGRGGINPIQVGLGSRLASIDSIQTQGSLQTTARPLDLALSGDGFFVVGSIADITRVNVDSATVPGDNRILGGAIDNSVSLNYTRAGNFYLDNNGYIVNSNGMYLIGETGEKRIPSQVEVNAANLALNEATLFFDVFTDFRSDSTNLQRLASNWLEAQRTFEDATKASVDSGGTDPILNAAATAAGNARDKARDEFLNVYNSTFNNPNGRIDQLNEAGVELNTSIGDFINDTGQLVYELSNPIVTRFADDPTDDINVLSRLVYHFQTMRDSVNNAFNAFENFVANAEMVKLPSWSDQLSGNPGLIQIPPTARSFSISGDGKVSFIDQFGSLKVAGQLMLAKFPNAAGLERVGENLFQQSTNSGSLDKNGDGIQLAEMFRPGANGSGTIVAGTLEMSNVDLSEEFTEMITAQRGFQANTRIITTSDEILQELVNLKR
ncbi:MULTISPECIES: flagellar hook-basal body complex protein [Bacillus]|uniref:flagellar hook-basal body complex protein n=1 Tax=Bacillus TaxID=1386 RepID=UPI000BB84193|nr:MULTISPECIES: flagellar hook-basal body complex protein [Bacillus]